MKRLILFVGLTVLTSCGHTFYKYELDKLCEVCSERGGMSRFYYNSSYSKTFVYCNDGSELKITVQLKN